MATNQLTEYMSGKKCLGFTPHPFYSYDGDFVTYYFTDEECYADRRDDLLTVFRSFKDNGWVGFKLKGVRLLLEKLGDFGFQVFGRDGKMMLGMLFLPGPFLVSTPDVLELYAYFGEKTKSVPLNEEDFQCV